MEQAIPATEDKAHHPMRQGLSPAFEPEQVPVRSTREDVAFFLVSFASAFIILYGFIL